MKYTFLFVLLLLLFAAACRPDPEDPIVPIIPTVIIYPTDTLPDLGQIHFNNMQIGQRSRYVYFYIPEFTAPDTVIDYRPDTLVVVITGKEGEEFIVQEFITQGSISHDSAVNNIYAGDSILTYHLRVDQDSLHMISVPPNTCWCTLSRIFVTPTQALPLAPVTAPQATFIGWSYSQSYDLAYVENFMHWGQTFDRLNIVWDNRGVPSDGGRFLFAYSASHGLVRWGYRGSWIETDGHGWDLLPE